MIQLFALMCSKEYGYVACGWGWGYNMALPQKDGDAAMDMATYNAIDAHMRDAMRDSAHDCHHVYRVLYAALDMAAYETRPVDTDVLLAACLLHDIGRDTQRANPSLSHAQIGGEMAYDYLLSIGWEHDKAAHVRECVTAHRYRGDNPPQSTEAQILFDADKLDAAGALGIARTLIYGGQESEPIYLLSDSNEIVLESGEETGSFFEEYEFKLKNVYGAFYTKRAKDLAAERRAAAVSFRDNLYGEIDTIIRNGNYRLTAVLNDND